MVSDNMIVSTTPTAIQYDDTEDWSAANCSNYCKVTRSEWCPKYLIGLELVLTISLSQIMNLMEDIEGPLSLEKRAVKGSMKSTCFSTIM